MVRAIKRFAGVVLNPSIDHTGTHRANIAQIKRFLELEGYMVHVYLIKTESDLGRLVKGAHANNYEFLHLEQAHFMGIQVDGEFLFDRLKIPVFSQLRDHWFYPWVWRNLKSLPNNARILHTSELFRTVESHLGGYHEHTTHTSQLAKQSVAEADRQPGKIFYSGTCLSIEAAMANAAKSVAKNLVDRVMDETIDSTCIPDWIWDLDLVDGGSVNVDGYNLSLDGFYRLFELARTRVRSNILTVASGFDVAMHVKGGWEPPQNAVCHFSNQPLPFLFSNYLAGRANCVLSDQATFREELGERAVTAIDGGQLVIARRNRFLENIENSSEGRLFLYQTLSELTELLSVVSDLQPKLGGLSERIPQRFSVYGYVRTMIQGSKQAS